MISTHMGDERRKSKKPLQAQATYQTLPLSQLGWFHPLCAPTTPTRSAWAPAAPSRPLAFIAPYRRSWTYHWIVFLSCLVGSHFARLRGRSPQLRSCLRLARGRSHRIPMWRRPSHPAVMHLEQPKCRSSVAALRFWECGPCSSDEEPRFSSGVVPLATLLQKALALFQAR